jgi:exopolysaccharide biosynthesis WecB/TagA/CpsF family protein
MFSLPLTGGTRPSPCAEVSRTMRSPGSSAVHGADMLALVDHMAPVADATAELALARRLARPERPTVVSFVNAHAFNLAWGNEEMRRLLVTSDVLLRDGVGMEMLLAKLDRPAGRNMNGTDFIPRILAEARGKRIVLYGTQEPHLSAARDALADRGILVVATEHGFEADGHYVEAAKSHQPDVIVLAMGMPKQERVAALLARSLTGPCLIVNGGAILDFLAERFPRAPTWVRRMKAEWLWRLGQEPVRLFRRYVTGNALFLWRASRLARLAPSITAQRALEQRPAPAE